MSKQEVHQVSTGGQQRSREEAALQAPWSRVGQMAYSFSRSQTWEAPGLQDHRKPPGRFCANQRSSHTSGGMQPWARVRLGEWSLGWILVSIHQFPTHLANPETLLWWGAGSWGHREVQGAAVFLLVCAFCYIALEVWVPGEK